MTKYADYYRDENGHLVSAELQPEDDAATANWGSNWQMPNVYQIIELANSEYTTTEWTTINGVNGCEITSNINGNSIFLPAAIGREGTPSFYVYEGAGYYWSRSREAEYSIDAYFLALWPGSSPQVSYLMRNLGFSVRPVVKQ